MKRAILCAAMLALTAESSAKYEAKLQGMTPADYHVSVAKDALEPTTIYRENVSKALSVGGILGTDVRTMLRGSINNTTGAKAYVLGVVDKA